MPIMASCPTARVDEQQDESRELVAGEKRHPADFALWRKAEPEHILRWNSPWGVGFPGWHIECSAMAKKYLGANFDIHGGGIDNIYPHNENEIAQSESANDVGFANYWMLTGSLNVLDPDEGIPVKMSKSLGNYITIKDALRSYRPGELRYFILTSHYSNPVVYSDEALGSAKSGWERADERPALGAPAAESCARVRRGGGLPRAIVRRQLGLQTRDG